MKKALRIKGIAKNQLGLRKDKSLDLTQDQVADINS